MRAEVWTRNAQPNLVSNSCGTVGMLVAGSGLPTRVTESRKGAFE